MDRVIVIHNCRGARILSVARKVGNSKLCGRWPVDLISTERGAIHFADIKMGMTGKFFRVPYEDISLADESTKGGRSCSHCSKDISPVPVVWLVIHTFAVGDDFKKCLDDALLVAWRFRGLVSATQVIGT